MQCHARESLIAETGIDVDEVRRAVRQVGVVVVERQPLRFDDRAQRGLVVAVHPAEEDRVRDEVAHRVAMRHVETRSDLPRSTHQRLAVRVSAAVTPRIRVAAESLGIEARSDRRADAEEVLGDHRRVVDVHRPDVGVAFAHAVLVVTRAVEHVQPVPHLVRDDCRVARVRATATREIIVDGAAVVERVASRRLVHVRDETQVGRRVRGVQSPNPIADRVDTDHRIGLRRGHIGR